MAFWVPPKVAHELREETRAYQASLDLVCTTDRTCDEWDRELRRLDPYLKMRKAPDRPVLGMPLHAGCYHLIRDNPGAPPSVTPILSDEGGFRMPPGSLLEKLKSLDLQDGRVVQERRLFVEMEAKRQEKEKLDRREERQAHALDRWRAVSQASVSMNRDTPWAQNFEGTKKNGRRPKVA